MTAGAAFDIPTAVANGTYCGTICLVYSNACIVEDDFKINVGCFDLALIKVLTSTGEVMPGDNVTFDITVFNQGTIDAYDVDVTDYFPTCLNYDSAAYSSHTSGSTTPVVIGNLTNDGFEITEIPAQESVVVTVTMIIDASCTELTIVNNAEITGGSDSVGGTDVTDRDSTPGDAAGSPPDNEDNDISETNGDDDYDPAVLMITIPPECNVDCGNFPWDGSR